MNGSTERSRPVKTAAVISHGRVDVRAAAERVRAVAADAGVLVLDDGTDPREADLAIALGGDGTILRSHGHLLGSDVPVIGVNYGRVGFLASIEPAALERDLARVLAGDYMVIELPTLEMEVAGSVHVAVNDFVATSAMLGRMVELAWAVGGEDVGVIPCDGMICSTPSGSTAYNLSNGGPVLVWGLDAMVLTFVAPHALVIRPLVVPRGPDIAITNLTADREATVLVDGQRVGMLPTGSEAVVRVGSQPSLLATLPEVTFFHRYAAAFGR